MPRHRPQSIAKTFSDAKAEYAGMTENRFRRRRPGVNGVGGSGDGHYQDAESRFIRMREYARAMVRDDGCAKFVIGRRPGGGQCHWVRGSAGARGVSADLTS